MDDFLFWLAAADLALCLAVGYRLVWSARSIKDLHMIEPLTGNGLPSVSIVVAARNEARNLEVALQSLLNLDYDNYEIIVVNDRSTDGTAQVLDRMAAQYSATGESTGTQFPGAAVAAPRLNVVQLETLPPGWLGKNHALFRGASQASGEYLLFTDADIVMDPSVLRRTVGYMGREQIDHLAMMFRIIMPSWLLESFVVAFSVYFFAHVKPWKVRDPKSPAHIGVGGFNLLKRAVYFQIGTHEAIAMRPDDDIKLGKIVKKHGFRQDVLMASELMHVEWYASLKEMVLGLEKNAFAGVDYSVTVTVVASVVILTFHAFPFIAVLFTTGWTQILFAAVIAALLAICANAARRGKLRMSAALGFPIAVVLFVYILWRTMLLNLWQGGIRWRDTFYPLAELKANKV